MCTACNDVLLQICGVEKFPQAILKGDLQRPDNLGLIESSRCGNNGNKNILLKFITVFALLSRYFVSYYKEAILSREKI